MNKTGRLGILAAVVSALALGTACAQTSQSQQNQKNQQNQTTPQNQQSQGQDNQYTGVSNPPPDSTIQATELPAPAQPTPPAKPSPAIPASPSNPAGTQANAAPANPAPAANPDDGIVTSAPPPGADDSANGDDSNNPDYGIVTSVPPANPTPASGWNPNNAIVNYVPVDPNALGAGTNITVRLQQNLSTTSTEVGSTFRAEVSQNVYNGSQLVIPAGAEMRGRVVHVSHGHHLINRATIMLRPDVIVLPDGTAYHLYAVAVQSMAPGTTVNEEGGIVASHHFAKDAVEYGAGAGIGAAAGGAIGGPVGAGAGAVVGTGLVGTHMLRQPTQSADLPQNSVLVFSLTEPMPLTPTRN